MNIIIHTPAPTSRYHQDMVKQIIERRKKIYLLYEEPTWLLDRHLMRRRGLSKLFKQNWEENWNEKNEGFKIIYRQAAEDKVVELKKSSFPEETTITHIRQTSLNFLPSAKSGRKLL